MQKCKISVVGTSGGVSIWCDTCKDPVAWSNEFSLAEVKATAKGHKEVRAKARAAYLAEKRRRFYEMYPHSGGRELRR